VAAERKRRLQGGQRREVVQLVVSEDAVRKHWQRYRPKMYRELEQRGSLEESVRQAVQQTKDALVDALQAGMNPDQAWESVREMWAFLPPEAGA
jgi:hypothetical protein